MQDTSNYSVSHLHASAARSQTLHLGHENLLIIFDCYPAVAWCPCKTSYPGQTIERLDY